MTKTIRHRCKSTAAAGSVIAFLLLWVCCALEAFSEPADLSHTTARDANGFAPGTRRQSFGSGSDSLRTVKLSFFNATWEKVLKTVAEATG